MTITQEQLDLYNTVQSRLKLTRQQAEAMPEVPEYTLWQVLTRYDEACGGKTAGKEWRYKIMYWIFQGKWKPSDEVSGNDLTPAEVHVMARWSDPSRKADFEREVKAVMALLGHEQDYPLADHITTPVDEGAEIDDSLTPEEQKEVFADKFGLRKYKMKCGHLNDGYTSYAHPVCNACLEKSREELDNPLFEKSLTIDITMDW